jgi:Fic family protein
MPSDDPSDRHSKALTPDLITDPAARAELEARNALRQFDLSIRIVDEWIAHRDRPFRLRPSIIMQLHSTALEGLSSFAGRYRPAGVAIGGSSHQPPKAFQVPEFVEELCEYVNDNWDKSALHLCAYVMWRLNWIHPFDDGNGRTSRAVSYVVLCVRLGFRLPGRRTIPEQIAENKPPYYRALEAADAAYRDRRIDVTALESLLDGMLAKQLIEVYRNASTSADPDLVGVPKLH